MSVRSARGFLGADDPQPPWHSCRSTRTDGHTSYSRDWSGGWPRTAPDNPGRGQLAAELRCRADTGQPSAPSTTGAVSATRFRRNRRPRCPSDHPKDRLKAGLRPRQPLSRAASARHESRRTADMGRGGPRPRAHHPSGCRRSETTTSHSPDPAPNGHGADNADAHPAVGKRRVPQPLR
jgi:hypothetical protein